MQFEFGGDVDDDDEDDDDDNREYPAMFSMCDVVSKDISKV